MLILSNSVNKTPSTGQQKTVVQVGLKGAQTPELSEAAEPSQRSSRDVA